MAEQDDTLNRRLKIRSYKTRELNIRQTYSILTVFLDHIYHNLP